MTKMAAHSFCRRSPLKRMTARFIVYNTSANECKVVASFDKLEDARVKLSKMHSERQDECDIYSNMHLGIKRDADDKVIVDQWEICVSGNNYKGPHLRKVYRPLSIGGPVTVIGEFGILATMSPSDYSSFQQPIQVWSTEQKSTVVKATIVREKILMGDEYVQFVKTYFNAPVQGDSTRMGALSKVYRLDSLWSLSEQELSELCNWVKSRVTKFVPGTMLNVELVNYLGTLLGRTALLDIESGNRYLQAAKLMGYNSSPPNQSTDAIVDALPEWVGMPMDKPYQHLVKCELLNESKRPTDWESRENFIDKIIDDMHKQLKTDDDAKLIKHIYGHVEMDDVKVAPIPYVMVLTAEKLIKNLKNDECKELIIWALAQSKPLAQDSQCVESKDAGVSSSSSSSSTDKMHSSAHSSAHLRLAELFSLLGNLYEVINETDLSSIYYFQAATMGGVSGTRNILDESAGWEWLPAMMSHLEELKLPI